MLTTAPTEIGTTDSANFPLDRTLATGSARDLRTNKPLPLRRANTAKKRAERIHKRLELRERTVERAATRRTWDGSPTKHQQRELDDLRSYELARDNDELPDLSRAMGGTTLVALVEAGRLGTYRVPRGAYDQLSLDKKERALIGHLLDAQLRHGAEWVVARHVDFADALEICETDAARAMRRLCRDSFVRRQPLYDEVTIEGTKGKRLRRHARAASAYQITGRVLVLLGLREPDTMAERHVATRVSAAIAGGLAAAQVSEKYLATETPGLSGNPDLPGGLVAPRLEVPAGEDAAGSFTVPAAATDVGYRGSDRAERTAAPSEAPEGMTDGRSLASLQRREAMLRRELSNLLDRCSEREASALQAKQRIVSERLAAELDDLRRERARLFEATANLLREYGRGERRIAVLGDDDGAYQRDLEERRRRGEALPAYAEWQLEQQAERNRRRLVLERIRMPDAELAALLDGAADRAERADEVSRVDDAADDDETDGGAP